MSQDTWTAVDEYFAALMPSDPALDAALDATARAGLPAMSVAPNQGQLLHLLALACGARSILEIGTLGGYSTIWLARALPAGGRLVTLEADPRHAAVARANIAHAGLAAAVDLREGQALDTLPQLQGPFDLVFIDADKANLAAYFDWAITLSRPGSLIISDNVVRDGKVIDPTSADPSVQGARRFTAAAAADRRVRTTAIQTVGSKGYDGFALSVVLGRGDGD